MASHEIWFRAYRLADAWRKPMATVVAAVVATSVTTMLVGIAVSIDNLNYILEMRDASMSVQQLFAYDFQKQLAWWPIETIKNLFLAPLSGIAFGFVGAFIFLAVGFAIARHTNATRRGYVLAGALIGFVHSAFGLLLRSVEVLPWGLRTSIDPIVGWIGLIGGFLLTQGRPLFVSVTFAAATIAGAMAGFVYARILRFG